VARSVRPRLELKGFTRIDLDAGEVRTVTFSLHAERTALYDPAEGWVVEPGTIEVHLGSSSDRIHLRGSFEIAGEARVLERRRVLTTPVR
jgi:hypothetical protein